MRCPLCSARPAKRLCPALDREICPVCCGTKRQVEIRCPADCSYLAASRVHPPAAVRRQQDQDVALLSPALAGLSEPRQQLFLFALTLIDRFKGDGLDAASDADAADAAAALAGTYETASKGLIYEQRPGSVPSQRMADGIRGTFEQLGRGRPAGFASDAAAVMRQVEDRVKAVQRAAPGDPRAFLALAGRMSARLAGPGRDGEQADSSPAAGAAAAGPSIILP
ncbi:MAG: hypothetical protein H6Q10_2055 [Acidobacteria bacterium]|nr:hypothetical protein [Acidobacteriota bacterium]